MTFQFSAPPRLAFVNQTIFHEGDESQMAYVIEQGVVEIFSSRDGAETVLERLGPGEIIAEMALIENAPHTASARAIGAVTLRAVTESKLDDLRDELRPRSWAIVSMMVMRPHMSVGRLRHHLVSKESAIPKIAAEARRCQGIGSTWAPIQRPDMAIP